MLKRWVSTILALVLLITSIPSALAQEVEEIPSGNVFNPSTTVTSTVYDSQEITENFDPEDLITVSTLTEQFRVTREWVVREMLKGYGLHHIYQGLQLQEQGGSYEEFITAKYPNPPLNPLLLAEEKMKQDQSVTELVYQSNTVTDSVYDRKPSVTESTYFRMKAMASSKPYDEIALKRLPLRQNQAPYSVGNRDAHISTVDGSLHMEITDMVLRGVNGLDFELRRIYDSTRAKDDIYVKYDNRLSNETEQTHEESYFPIGNGWTWDISYMSMKNHQWYIYIAGVGTYMLDDNYNLKGYPWDNLSLTRTFDEPEVLGNKPFFELMDSRTGRRQYFDDNGRLIQISDVHGNKLMFEYGGAVGYGDVLQSIRVANNEGRTIDGMYFFYNRDNVSVHANQRILTYKKGILRANNKDQAILREVVDPQGRSTKYDYHTSPMKFNLIQQYKGNENDSWGINEWIVLDLIEHPTKAMTKLSATRVKKKIGAYAIEEQLRYTGVEPTFNTPSDTKRVNTLHVKHYKDEGRYLEHKDEKMTFTTEVIEGMKQTIYKYDQVFVDEHNPSVTYLTQTDEKIMKTQERRETKYEYDRSKARTLPIQIRTQSYNGTVFSPANVTKRSYNEHGLLTSETNPLGAVSRYQYEMLSTEPYYMVMTESDQPGAGGTRIRTGYIYDAMKLKQVTAKGEPGHLLSQTNYAYDRYGNPIEIRMKGDQEDTVVKQEFSSRYNALYPTKQTVEVKDADGRMNPISVEAEYDAMGNMTKYVDGRGQATAYTYDKLGRTLTETLPDGAQTKIEYDDIANKIKMIDPTGLVTETHYDPIGRKVKEINGRGEAAYLYDHRSRMIKKYDYNGSWVNYKHDDWDRKIEEEVITFNPVRTVYDDVNHTVTVIDGANNTLRTTYDQFGRLQSREEVKPSGAVILERYEYDILGNLMTHTDGNQQVTKYAYDPFGRVSSVTDAEGKTTSYGYNMAGELTAIKYPDGNQVQKSYDAIGRLVKQTDPMQQIQKFYYDNNGNIVKRIDRKGQTQQFVYNNRDLLTSSISADETISYIYDTAGRRTSMTDGSGTTQYTYYPTGEISSMMYPDQTVLQFDYEKRGLRTKQTVSRPGFFTDVQTEYNLLARTPHELQVIDGQGTKQAGFTYSYGPELYDRITLLRAANGLQESYAYDGFNLAGIQQKQGDSLFGNYSYTYDNYRNIVAKNDNGVAHQFSYDPLNRIKSSSQFNEAYTYDQRDNRSTLQSDQVPDIEGATYTYDKRNRLVKVTTEEGKAVSYRYNGDNLMIERTEGGVTTRYYYDDRAKIVAEGKVEGNGSITITAAYVHDSNGKLLARQVPGQGMQYYVSNGHGDVTEIRDAQGNVLNRYTYDIWGNPMVQEERVPNIFRYSGEYWDATTNLQYLRARWYDPSVGRFINEDTYEGEIKNPLSLNLYTYVQNNPLIYSDPTGHRVWLIHGTFADADTWTSDFVKYVEGLFNESSKTLEWSGKNTKGARSDDAEDFVNTVYQWHSKNPDEPIRLVGHSHGGNVAILLANLLAEKGMKVETLITIATPVREYKLESKVGQHIQMYNNRDVVQMDLGGYDFGWDWWKLWNLGAGSTTTRKFNNAENVRAKDAEKKGTRIQAHSAMHSNVDIWKKYIEPILKLK